MNGGLKLLSFGEIVWDIFGDDAALGGSPLNLAAYSAMLGNTSWLVSAVGEDDLGARALDILEKLGVKREYITRTPDKETGTCMVTYTSENAPQYLLKTDAAYDYIAMPELPEPPDLLAFATLALRSGHNKKVLTDMLKAFPKAQVFADLNIRPPFSMPENILFCLQNAGIVKFSEEEMPALSRVLPKVDLDPEILAGEIFRNFDGVKGVLVTKGENGSAFFAKNEKPVYCKAYPANPVSTVGAGDSFSAAFLTEYFKTGNTLASLRLASRISALVCERREAVSAEICSLVRDIYSDWREKSYYPKKF